MPLKIVLEDFCEVPTSGVFLRSIDCQANRPIGNGCEDAGQCPVNGQTRCNRNLSQFLQLSWFDPEWSRPWNRKTPQFLSCRNSSRREIAGVRSVERWLGKGYDPIWNWFDDPDARREEAYGACDHFSHSSPLYLKFAPAHHSKLRWTNMKWQRLWSMTPASRRVHMNVGHWSAVIRVIRPLPLENRTASTTKTIAASRVLKDKTFRRSASQNSAKSPKSGSQKEPLAMS